MTRHARRAWLRAAAATPLVAALALPAAAAAQDKPPLRVVKPPLRVVVGYSPGGSVDTVARLLSERLRDALGRPVTLAAAVPAASPVRDAAGLVQAIRTDAGRPTARPAPVAWRTSRA